jgi:hypothetical protein
MENLKLTADDISAALDIIHREYFMNVMALLAQTPQTELVYVKVPVVTHEGGNYLVSILHIDGPKLNLDAIRETSEP